MEKNVLLHSLKTQFLISFSMLEKIIETCPDELWNKKVSGYVFWQQLIHAFAGIHGWLREDKLEIMPPFSIFNGKKNGKIVAIVTYDTVLGSNSVLNIIQ